MHEHGRAQLLQWGRALVSAEMQAVDQNQGYSYWLQWGRALVSAEIHVLQPHFHRIVMLQWGRALVSAEITLSDREKRPANDRFNGAALS